MVKKIFIANKLVIFIISYLGVGLSLFLYGKIDLTRLLFFTAQSNLWIGTNSLLIFINFLVGDKRNSVKKLYQMQYIFTVSITMTGIVYCFLLAPFSNGILDNPWNIPSLFTHVITPVFAVVDFLLDSGVVKIKAIDTLYALIPPFIYFFTTSILELFNIDFGYGEPFPYFFMNYSSPAKLFGFSKQFPYYIGSFYWYVILFGVGFLISVIYRKIKLLSINKSVKLH